MVPPVLGGLDVHGRGIDLIDEFFGAIGEGGGGICGSNKP